MTQPASTPAPTPQEAAEETSKGEVSWAWGGVARGSHGWLLSLALHMLAVIALALWYLPPLTRPARPELLAEATSADEDLDDFQEVVIDPVQLDSEPVEFEVQPDTDVLAEEVNIATLQDLTTAPSFTELSEFGLTAAVPSVPTDLLGVDGDGTTGRGKMSRTAVIRRGGNAESEEAIERALNWLAAHQNADGSWSLVHTLGACRGRCPNPAGVPPQDSLRAGTGLALLPFLGAGHTQRKGRHRRVVSRGLDALADLSKQEKVGASWRDPPPAFGAYSHAIAAIVLSEAYGMTGQSNLGGYAQAAIDHIVASQGADGGWRYNPGDTPGDTSIVGWNIMALKSAYLAGLNLPPQTAAGASRFLDTVAVAGGSEYTYLPKTSNPAFGPSVGRSSIGLLCRMYLGWKRDNPALIEGVRKIAETGPSETNYYYNYYASQVLFQHTDGRGSQWRAWNTQLRDMLVRQQETEGHARGSWFAESRGSSSAHSDRGGRLYMTALATMTLEVYYRYLPIYQSESVEKGFPE